MRQTYEITRPCAALQAVGLDGIVGPQYSLGGNKDDAFDANRHDSNARP